MSAYSSYDYERVQEQNADAPKLEFHRRRTVVARKPWKCRFCSRDYGKGDMCFVDVFKIEGQFGSERSCSPNGDCMDYEGTK